MLGFEGVMEIEVSEFVVLLIVAGDPQPVIDNKAIGSAREESLRRPRNEFILPLWEIRKLFRFDDLNRLKICGDWRSLIPASIEINRPLWIIQVREHQCGLSAENDCSASLRPRSRRKFWA
jgi:hypothetical protein